MLGAASQIEAAQPRLGKLRPPRAKFEQGADATGGAVEEAGTLKQQTEYVAPQAAELAHQQQQQSATTVPARQQRGAPGSGG